MNRHPREVVHDGFVAMIDAEHKHSAKMIKTRHLTPRSGTTGDEGALEVDLLNWGIG
jgi:hypothetical protein